MCGVCHRENARRSLRAGPWHLFLPSAGERGKWLLLRATATTENLKSRTAIVLMLPEVPPKKVHLQKGLWMEGVQQERHRGVMPILPLQGKPDGRQVHYAS